jgi:hypothetical protein
MDNATQTPNDQVDPQVAQEVAEALRHRATQKQVNVIPEVIEALKQQNQPRSDS